MSGLADESGRGETLAVLHRPFRSHRGRLVGWVSALGQALVLLSVAAILPWSGPNRVAWPDRAGFVVLAALIGWFLVRLAEVSADPSPEGLVVRNVLLTRRLNWSQIEGLRFGSSDPWLQLDVSDGDPVAVMAVQRADHERGRAEADRLATLLAFYTSPR